MSDIVERLKEPVMLHSNPEQTNAERREAAEIIKAYRRDQDHDKAMIDKLRIQVEEQKTAVKPFLDAAGGIPESVSYAAPFARVSNDARTKGTFNVITIVELRAMVAAFTSENSRG